MPELGDQVSPSVFPVWEHLLCGPGWRTQPEPEDMEPAGQRKRLCTGSSQILILFLVWEVLGGRGDFGDKRM